MYSGYVESSWQGILNNIFKETLINSLIEKQLINSLKIEKNQQNFQFQFYAFAALQQLFIGFSVFRRITPLNWT